MPPRLLGLALLSAVLYGSAAMVPALWPLPWIGMAPLLVGLASVESRRTAFLAGWVTGIVEHMLPCWWAWQSIGAFFELGAPVSLPLFVLLLAYMGLRVALWSLGLHVLRAGNRSALPWLAAALFVPIEYLWPMIFPLSHGITQIGNRLMIQATELGGISAVVALLFLVNGSLAELWLGVEGARRRALGIAGMVMAAAIFGAVRLHQFSDAGAGLRIGVVQADDGAIRDRPAEFRHRQFLQLRQTTAELARQGAQMVVWPESAYTYDVHRDLKHDADGDYSLQNGVRVPLLFQTMSYELDNKKHYNSAIMFDANGNVSGLYDKQHLVWLGESSAPPPFDKMLANGGHVTPGGEPVMFSLDGHPFSALICIEDLDAALVRDRCKRGATLLVNLTNDAWYGGHDEPYQHLWLASLRCIENRVDMVRACNGGVSVRIDATGRMQPQLDPSKAGSMVVTVQPHTGGGFYTMAGDWLPAWCGFWCLWWFAGKRE